MLKQNFSFRPTVHFQKSGNIPVNGKANIPVNGKASDYA